MENDSGRNELLHSPFSILHFLLFIACLIPFGQLAYRAYTGRSRRQSDRYDHSIHRLVGADLFADVPGRNTAAETHRLERADQVPPHARTVRVLLCALHFATYLVLDHFFNLPAIGKDILKRPYVTAGFTALVMMIPLALTSTAAMIRRLGKRWQQLHRLVYVAAIARRDSFLLAGQSRHSPAGTIRLRPGALVGLPSCDEMGQAQTRRRRAQVRRCACAGNQLSSLGFFYSQLIHPRAQRARVNAENLRRALLAMNHPTGFRTAPG